MKLDNLKQAREALAEKNAIIAEVYKQGGEDLDMTKVNCVEGSTSAEKVAAMQVVMKEANEAADVAKSFEDLKAARDNAIAKDRAAKGAGGGKGDIDTPADMAGAVKSLGDMIIESKAYTNRDARAKADIGTDIDLKTLFQTTAGWAPESLRTGRVVPIATRPIEVTDIIPQGRTDFEKVVYMEETTFTNAAAETAEGGAYPEATLELTERESPVRKIAVFLPVTEEQLEDEAGAASYINQRLPFMIRQRYDGQILNGDGIAPNLTGILNTAGIQTQARGADTNEDAFYKAMVKVMTTGQAIPSNHIMNPINWQTIRLRKTADGIYIFGSPNDPGEDRLWGLPVVKAQAIAANTGLTGDFPNFIQSMERRGIEIKISDSHSDFFIKGKLAIRASFRVALPVYRAAAFSSVTGLN